MKNKLKEFKNELNLQFYTAYQSLPVSLYLNVKDELCEACFWTLVTFYNRLNGSRDIKEIEMDRIEQVFHKYGIQVFKQTT